MFSAKCPICGEDFSVSVAKYETRNGVTYTLICGCAHCKIEFRKNFNTAEELADDAEVAIQAFVKDALAIKNRKQILAEKAEEMRKEREMRKLERLRREEDARQKEKSLEEQRQRNMELMKKAQLIIDYNAQIFEKQYEVETNAGEKLIFKIDYIECLEEKRSNYSYPDWDFYWASRLAIKLKCMTRPVVLQMARNRIYFDIFEAMAENANLLISKIECEVKEQLRKLTISINRRLTLNSEVGGMGAEKCIVCHETPTLRTTNARDPEKYLTWLDCGCGKTTERKKATITDSENWQDFRHARYKLDNDKQKAVETLVPYSLEEWNSIAKMTAEEYSQHREAKDECPAFPA